MVFCHTGEADIKDHAPEQKSFSPGLLLLFWRSFWPLHHSRSSCFQDNRSHPTDVCRPVCKTAEVSTCKTVDIIDKYFNDEENPRPKINIMKTAKDSEVYPRAGRRRHQLARYITCNTDTAITTGSRIERCNRCQYTSSKKRIHLHYRQHFTKHIVAVDIVVDIWFYILAPTLWALQRAI